MTWSAKHRFHSGPPTRETRSGSCQQSCSTTSEICGVDVDDGRDAWGEVQRRCKASTAATTHEAAVTDGCPECQFHVTQDYTVNAFGIIQYSSCVPHATLRIRQ